MFRRNTGHQYTVLTTTSTPACVPLLVQQHMYARTRGGFVPRESMRLVPVAVCTHKPERSPSRAHSYQLLRFCLGCHMCSACTACPVSWELISTSNHYCKVSLKAAHVCKVLLNVYGCPLPRHVSIVSVHGDTL
jgi:hypothetical protein